MKSTTEFDIDELLTEIGQFGIYQFINYLLIAIPLSLTASYTLAYVFTAGDLNYRCAIPECDTNQQSYRPSWLTNAVPYSGEVPSQCLRYEYVDRGQPPTCGAENFNQSVQIKCNEFVYENDEKTIVNEWNLTCEENKWKLALVGTINTFGQLVALPFTGYVSDRYGRRFAFAFGMVICGIFGVLRSFSWNYISFLVFEFLDPALGSGVYTSGFILGMELVGSSYRIRGAMVINIFYTFGAVLLGLLAMATKNWRVLLQAVYIPAFVFVGYLWVVPESVRWLSTNGRKLEALKVLVKAAKYNRRQLSGQTLHMIEELKSRESLPTGPEQGMPSSSREPLRENREYELKKILKYPSMLWRVANCSFCWLTNTFVYYGLSLNSVNIGGDKYTNFILISLVEIPGYFACWLLSDTIGRKKTQFGSLILAGVTCIVTAFVGQDGWLNLVLFLIGKFAITTSFTTLYTYTAELFPTNLRHSLLGVCSMFGRIGSMIAPQTPLLEAVMKSLPLFLYGATGLLSGFLVLFFPETLNTKLPDTLEEAMNVGDTKIKRESTTPT